MNDAPWFLAPGGITPADAERMVETVLETARSRGSTMGVVVVDGIGTAIGQGQTGDASADTLELALAKAFIACTFDLETRRLGPAVTHPPRRAAAVTGGDEVIAGGIPIHDALGVVGAVGVSGGESDDDQSGAETAIDVLQGLLADRRVRLIAERREQSTDRPRGAVPAPAGAWRAQRGERRPHPRRSR